MTDPSTSQPFTGPQYMPGSDLIKALVLIPLTILVIGTCLMCLSAFFVSTSYTERLLAREVHAVMVFSPWTWFTASKEEAAAAPATVEQVPLLRLNPERPAPVRSSTPATPASGLANGASRSSTGAADSGDPVLIPGSDQEPVIRRARWMQRVVSTYFPEVADEPKRGIGLKFENWCHKYLGDSLESHWNNRIKANFSNILPMMWVRLELLFASTLVFIPSLYCAYFLGERRARIRMREGYRKSDHRFAVAFLAFRFGLFVSWIGVFIPFMPPLVYWLIPSIVGTWWGVVWARTNLIEP